MKHDHAAFGIGHNSGCRLCSCTDREGLVEQLAADLWESRRIDDIPGWEDAGEYWHHAFRGFARAALDSLGG